MTGKRVVGETTGAPVAVQSASQATGEQRTTGEKLRLVPALDRLPVFVRAGAILPRQAVVQSTGEMPAGPLLLDVYPGEDCAGLIYLDDGHSTAFQRGALLRQAVRCQSTATGLTLSFEPREGSFPPWWRTIAVTVHGWRGGGRVELSGRPHAANVSTADETLTLICPTYPGRASLRSCGCRILGHQFPRCAQALSQAASRNSE